MGEHSTIEIQLNRIDKTYRVEEKIYGSVHIYAYKGWAHNGVTLSVEGLIRAQHPKQSDSSMKNLQILKVDLEICPPGKFNEGKVEIPFSFLLSALHGQTLYETYRGANVVISYTITAVCDRGIIKKALKDDTEFMLEIPTGEKRTDSSPLKFAISPSTLENVEKDELAKIADFRIVGKLHKNEFSINQPLTGEFTVELSVAPIRSIDLQLVRVETVSFDGVESKEASEVIKIQIGDGNICRYRISSTYICSLPAPS